MTIRICLEMLEEDRRDSAVNKRIYADSIWYKCALEGMKMLIQLLSSQDLPVSFP